jgi:ribose transport system substrate-binding protein
MRRCFIYKRLKKLLLTIMVLSVLTGCNAEKPAVNAPAEEPDNIEAQGMPVQTSKETSNKPNKKPNSEIIIALVPKSLDNPVFLDAKEESERVAKELGIKVEWLGSMQTDTDEQEAIVESLINRHVDGIIISCVDPVIMKRVINKAMEAGIKVATFDSDSPDSKRLFYCGTNNIAAGEACGKALINALREKGKLDTEQNLLIMTADKDSYNLNERLQSFLSTAEKGGVKLKLLDTLYCRDDINLAGDMLEKYIRKSNNVDVFFSTGGWPLIGPYESLPGFQNWCRNGGTSIVVDSFYPIVNAAKNGLADALIGQDFKKMGALGTRNIYNAIKGGSISSTFIDTGLEYGNKDNYDILLKNKTPWEIK